MRQIDIKGIETIDPNANFTVAEAARVLGITANAVRAWIHGKKMRFGKIGGRYYTKGSEIQKMFTPMGK